MTPHDYFFEIPKNQIFAILMQLLSVSLSHAYQKLPKQLNPPSKVNIEQATAICLNKSFSPKFVKNLENNFFEENGPS